MTTILRDIVYTFRLFRKTPGFTAVVVLTLALGIGANTAIFSVVHAVLLRPLPFGQPERLVVTWEVTPAPDSGPMFLSPPNYEDFRTRSREIERLAAFAPETWFLATEQGAVRLQGARVTANILDTLRIAPLAGRGFRPDDGAPGAPPVALISYALWQGSFGGEEAAVGRRVRIDGVEHEIIGVMPAGLDFPPPIDLESGTLPRRTDVWVPIATDLAAGGRSTHFLRGIGRLADGATFDSANADLAGIAAALGDELPDTNAGWSALVVPMSDAVLGDLRPALFTLFAAVTAVLLIACVNVANLLLSRATGRQREFAIRAALGARRRRLVSQALVESLSLALAGGLAGIGLAGAGTRMLVGLAPANVPRLEQAGLDPLVVAWALGLSLVTGLLFGLAPVARTFVPQLVHLLREGGRSAIGDTQGRLRDGLVVVEVALSLLLLVGAGLLFRSFLQLRGIDPGFRAERTLTMRVTLPRQYDQPTERTAAFADIEERVRALPGVEAAGLALALPLASDFEGTELAIEGEPPPADGTNLVNFSYVTPGWFEAMGIPVIEGRTLDGTDRADGEPAVVVNEAAARAYFGGTDPIGRRILYGPRPRRIVGVVGDVRLESIADAPFPAMYVPYYQSPRDRALTLVLRTRDAGSLASAVRDRIREVDPGIPVSEVLTMDDVVAEALAAPRFSSAVLSVFSLAALFLAAIGIYGVTSYATSLRVREIGVRMALGARRGDAIGLVMRHTLIVALLGIGVGMAGVLLSTRFLGTLLFGVEPTDPLTLAGVTLFLIAVAAVAAAIPAWRASRVDPVYALRYE